MAKPFYNFCSVSVGMHSVLRRVLPQSTSIRNRSDGFLSFPLLPGVRLQLGPARCRLETLCIQGCSFAGIALEACTTLREVTLAHVVSPFARSPAS
jgi:hypothetical protein